MDDKKETWECFLGYIFYKSGEHATSFERWSCPSGELRLISTFYKCVLRMQYVGMSTKVHEGSAVKLH